VTASASASAPAPSIAVKAADPSVTAVSALVERWRLAQNQLDFAGYGALYAPVFQGTKRVGERSFRFDRKRWLDDRKPMFTVGLEVRVSKLEVTRAGAHVVAFFEQEFRTPAFRDTGRKLLAFAQTPSGFQIVREEMLSSQVLGGGGSVTSVPGFFYARPDGVVLRSEIDERWLTPTRRELALRFRAGRDSGDPENFLEEGFLETREVNLPPEVTAFQGKTLHVTRAPTPGQRDLPEACVRKVDRIVVRNTAAPTFESVRIPMGFDHIYGSVVLGLFDQPCPGALWASETPPAKQYVPYPASTVLRSAAKLALSARGNFPELDARLLGDPAGSQLLFVRGTRWSDAPEPDIENRLFRVDAERPPLQSLGALDAWLVPRLAFDADGDGELEVLTEPADSSSTVYILKVKLGKISAHVVYSVPDFVCPG
jgi:hypothetical protein